MHFAARSSFRKAMIVVFLAFAADMSGQTFDFEGGLQEWTRTGLAFDAQPVHYDQVLSDRYATVGLGGDYWRKLRYPLGQHGEYLIASGNKAGDPPTGTLTSSSFALDPAHPYFSVLIGGTSDITHERLELQVHPSTADIDQLEKQIALWASNTVPAALSADAQRRDGDYLIVVSVTGTSEQLQQMVFNLPGFLFSREARVKLIDDSPKGHLNIDFIQFTSASPTARRTPVWGYADYHTHPTDYLAFGELNGVPTLWGRPEQPGKNYQDYQADPSLILGDLPRCTKGHNGGPLANPFLNAAQTLTTSQSIVLLFPHVEAGAPKYNNWPSFIAGAHEQLHITQVHRNYEGGLRLMVALATDNWGAEYLTAYPHHGHVALVNEPTSVVSQINAMKEIAANNHDWMEVAYSSDEARRIILQNKLAVILGVEVDQLGTYLPNISDEINFLWSLGVRAVTPIHAVDNKIGGAAVFIAPYNSLNDFLHRGGYDLRKDDLNKIQPAFFQIKEDKCLVPISKKVGECVEFRFDNTKQSRVYLGRCLASLGRFSPCLENKAYEPYATAFGQKNQLGLKLPFGSDYINALMDRGMILDTAHMSDESVKDMFNLIGQRLQKGHPECAGFSFESEVSDDCYQWAYPAIVSHAHFRAQAIYGSDDFPPSEYDISDRNVELVRRVGGVIGPFVANSRIAVGEGDHPTFENNCAMSSKGYGYSFHFALQRMHGAGVGMATDATFIPEVAPRFGKNACWAYHLARNPGVELKTHEKDRYAIHDQRDGVLYANRSVSVDSLASSVPLEPDVLAGKRVFDYNVDGLAHFGLVPDMLQDLKNLGLSQTDFEALFSSSESYLQMWEKAEQLSKTRK